MANTILVPAVTRRRARIDNRILDMSYIQFTVLQFCHSQLLSLLSWLLPVWLWVEL
jgi:hypothetical protein